MALSGAQVEELREALLSAFDEPSLKQMVRIGLEENLPAVASGVTLREVVYNLITWSERTGRTDALIAAAVASNPGNPALKAFAAKYQGDGDEPPPPPPPDKPQPPSGLPGGASIGVYVAGNLSTGGGDVVGGDKTVQGDEVRGDKIMGDQTKVGDIGAHAAVAIGPGATIVQQVVSEADLRDRENLRVLRQIVTKYWIEGVLEKSLNHEAVIRLGLTDRSGIVENRPWRVIPQLDEDESRDLPPGTHIVDVFDQMNQHLLILGEPGSGKTTLLLELARELIKRADANPLLPSPVVFNLSSWSQRKLSLADWLVAELHIRYNIPKKMAQVWVEQERLLPLLDGLDEVASICRDDCAKAINQYRQDHLVPLVVCSRRAEYERLAPRLVLDGAVLLQALTSAQVDAFLEKAAPSLNALRLELGRDGELRELAKSPLMLSIMALAYQDVPSFMVEQVEPGQTRQQHLFSIYIHRMFTRREALPLCSHADTVTWLKWLAVRLEQHSQTIFLIERLQPNWLSEARRSNYHLSPLLLAGPGYGVLVGTLLGVIFSAIYGAAFGFSSWLQFGNFFWLPGLISGAVVGAVFALFDWMTGAFTSIDAPERSRKLKTRLASSFFGAIFWGGYLAGSFVLLLWMIPKNTWESTSTSHGLAIEGLDATIRADIIFALFFAQIGALIGGLLGGIQDFHLAQVADFRPVHVMARFRFGLANGLMVGLVVGLFLGFGTFLGGGEAAVAFMAILLGLTLGMLGGLIFATVVKRESVYRAPSVVETQMPNQAIRQSAGISTGVSLMAGVGVWSLSGLAAELMVHLNSSRPDTIVSGLFWGLAFGLIPALLLGITIGLVSGGSTTMKHAILRLIMWRHGCAPLNYAKFLEYATSLIFLRKIGGGYIFAHRLIMEHFASMTPRDIERIATSLDAMDRSVTQRA